MTFCDLNKKNYINKNNLFNLNKMNLLYIILFFSVFLFPLSNERIIIDSPQKLSNQFPKKEIKIFFTKYGNADLGFKIRGKLYTPKKSSKTKNYSCKEIEKLNIIPDPDGSFLYPILLVSKGDCSYYEMSKNIQNSGYYMGIIIYDNNNIDNIIINEDNNKKDIFIPISIIGKDNGDKIIKYLEENEKENVIIDIEYTMIKSNVVNIEFFMQFGDEETYFLLHEFKKYYKKLRKSKSKLNISTIFITNELSGLSEKEKEKNCVSNGKYCLSRNLPRNKKIDGKKLILESLFHQCISKELGEEFFAFADYYYEECLYETKFKQFCGKKILSSYNKVEECIYKSFNIKKLDDNDIEDYFKFENNILENNRLIANNNNIKSIPTIKINGIFYNNELKANILFNNICSGFNYKNSACETKRKEDDDRISLFDILIIIIGVLSLNFLVYILCKKYVIKRLKNKLIEEPTELGGKIHTVVSSYLNLREIGDKPIEPNVLEGSINEIN